MLSHDEMIGLQSEEHTVVEVKNFKNKDQYVLHLIHTCAYEKAAKLAKNKRVLDLGCNMGYGSAIMSKGAKSLSGVDVSDSAIDVAKKQYPDIDFHLIDGKNLPFEDNTFDLVVSCQVIEHIVDLSLFINEIKRVLRDDGIVLFTTPNATIRLDEGMKPWYKFHVKEYKHDDLKTELLNYFSTAEVLGLFADKALYDNEILRVGLSREKARIKQKRIKKLWLAKIIYRFKKINRRRLNKLESDFIQRHTTENLYYQQEKLSESLDFMACCSMNTTSVNEAIKTIINK